MAPTRRAAVLALLLLVLAVLPGVAAAQDRPAMVRLVHLSAGVPAVDLYVDGTRTVAAVPFKTASRYRSLPAGGAAKSSSATTARSCSPPPSSARV